MIKLFLPDNPNIIDSNLYDVVLKKMNSNPIYNDDPVNYTNKFINTYKIKYYFFLDHIIKSHLYFDIDYAIFPREKMLNSVLGKIRWKIQGGKLFNIIKNDLLELGYIEIVQYESTKGKLFNYSSDQGLATRFRIVGDKDYKSYFFSEKSTNKKVLDSIINYRNKRKESRKNEIDLSNDLVKHNLKFMMALDFSQVDLSDLSDVERWQIEKFIEKDFIINNKFTGRTYTTFTNLKKTIRKKIMLDDERVVGVDISNSQIVFLAEVMKEKLKNEEIDPMSIYFFKYIALGKFYELIWKLWESDDEKVVDIILEGEDRDQIKRNVFAYLFNDAKHYEIYIENIFQEYFPQVFRVIRQIRGRSLALQMQSQEANIINTAYRNIVNKGIIAGTLFDSIYAKESDIVEVMGELKRQFQARNIKVNIKYTVNDVDQNPFIDNKNENAPIIAENTEYPISNNDSTDALLKPEKQLEIKPLERSYIKTMPNYEKIEKSSQINPKTPYSWPYEPPTSLAGRLNIETEIPPSYFKDEVTVIPLPESRQNDVLEYTKEVNEDFLIAISNFNGSSNLQYSLSKIQESIQWSNYGLHEFYKKELNAKGIKIDFQNFLFKYDIFVYSIGGWYYYDSQKHFTLKTRNDMFRIYNFGYQYYNQIANKELLVLI